jgi:hypothetical protein
MSSVGKTALAKGSNNCRLQTRPLVREGAPHQQTCNYVKVSKEKRRQFGHGFRMGA